MVLLLAMLAHGADVLTFDAVRVVEHGKASPSLTLHPGVSGSVEVSLDCGGGRSFTHSGAIAPGRDVVITLSGLPEGTHSCSGVVKLTDSSGGSGQMPLSLEVASLPELAWSYDLDDVDLEGHSLVAHPSRPLQDAVLRVIGVGGVVLDEQRGDLSDPSQPSFSWVTTEEVLKLVIEAADPHGFRGLLELSPWSYAIPHEDVVFASGSAELTSAETPKLDATWRQTQEVLAKYGDVVEIQLYVGGYTDTVGAASSNQALSERRARAIASWFRARGFTAPIWYQGFGEQGLAVATGDEVDEPRNRRAVYVLAAQQPAVSDELPASAWVRL